MQRYVLLFCLLFLLTVSPGVGFLPTPENGKPGDFTHQTITEKGIYEAAAVFISRYISRVVKSDTHVTRDAVNITEDFFRGDPRSQAAFGNVVAAIVRGNNEAQKMFGSMAIRTMSAEMIMAGHLLLQSIRDQIVTLATSPKYNQDEIRKMIGTYLFSMQMFYSNTNWVEMRGNVSNKELGIHGTTMMPVAPPDVATCVNCLINGTVPDPSACFDNVLVNDKYLTSGYNSKQGIPKPSTGANDRGKCSHGGKDDAYRTIPATGGINKETSDPVLSPHYFLHQAAGEAAVEATALFFIGEVSGLLDQLGPRIFGDLMGLPVACKDCLQPSLSLAYVIDTSLSMSEDLNQIKMKVEDNIMMVLSDPKNAPKHFVLSTFSDPLTLNTLRQTNNSQEMLDWFHNMTQDGGGDCPEYAYHGLLDALTVVRPGSCIFFYSDADPKDPELEADIIRIAKAKNVHISFLIKGSCNTGLPFYDNLESATKTTCLKQRLDWDKGRRKRSVEDTVGHVERSTKKDSRDVFLFGVVTGVGVVFVFVATVIGLVLTIRKGRISQNRQI